MLPQALGSPQLPVALPLPRIVVAEDEDVLAALIEAKLTRAGYRVILTKDGQAAWHAILAQRPDLVVLDWMMPGIDGLHLLGLIRDNPAVSATPVLMLTAVAQKSEVLTALEVGASDYVIKPFQPQHLLARIRRLLAHESKV